MIISASRRTDIPACFPDWFFNRLAAGFADVRNPMNPHQVSRVRLTPDVVDGFVFWTKNPLPMLARLGELDGRAFYFLFTLTPYGPDIEPGLPDKNDVLVPAFQALAHRIGAERVIWRYDPILVSERYPAAFHRERFAEWAARLADSTRTCIISFIDMYPAARRRLHAADLAGMSVDERISLAGDLAAIARRHGIAMQACAEPLDFSAVGIGHAACVDAPLFERQLGTPLRVPRGPALREGCRCLPSIDIGMYDTCRLGCRYCYACRSEAAMERLARMHDPLSTMLCGSLGPEDTIHERSMELLGRSR